MNERLEPIARFVAFVSLVAATSVAAIAATWLLSALLEAWLM